MKKILVSFMMVFILTGCFYSLVKQPVTSTVDATTKSSKTGKISCSDSPILSAFYSEIDCSNAVKKAMIKGGITQVHHVEKETKAILAGFFGTTITITVHGE